MPRDDAFSRRFRRMLNFAERSSQVAQTTAPWLARVKAELSQKKREPGDPVMDMIPSAEAKADYAEVRRAAELHWIDLQAWAEKRRAAKEETS